MSTGWNIGKPRKDGMCRNVFIILNTFTRV